ncbi:hypothetical protein J6590_060448 [Homalodisca vitripennis]|nr:hypothetical protein J6590_060448 [Homalodisca vitripennis]
MTPPITTIANSTSPGRRIRVNRDRSDYADAIIHYVAQTVRYSTTGKREDLTGAWESDQDVPVEQKRKRRGRRVVSRSRDCHLASPVLFVSSAPHHTPVTACSGGGWSRCAVIPDLRRTEGRGDQWQIPRIFLTALITKLDLASGPPVQNEPVDLSIKSCKSDVAPVVLQVPHYSPIHLKREYPGL